MSTSEQIRNIVIVRFSLRVSEWRRRLFFDERSRGAWFAYRAALFRQTLAASLATQTTPPARLYLLMDAGDRGLAERYLEGLEFTPIFSHEGDHHQQVAADLRNTGLVDHLALSRIDSDDIVECRYFEKINRQLSALAQEGSKTDLLVSCKGYRSNFIELQPLYYHDGPFITRFCRHYAGETPYFDHKTSGQYVHQKEAQAEWMQVIHGTNVANGFLMPNAAEIEPFLDGARGTGVLPKAQINPAWFRQWAGFDLPSQEIFSRAPMHGVRIRLRRLLRSWRGKY